MMPGETSMPVIEIFKVKTKRDGLFDKLKTHLVMRGDLQDKKYYRRQMVTNSLFQVSEDVPSSCKSTEGHSKAIGLYRSILVGKYVN
jgi:hypothetical protein